MRFRYGKEKRRVRLSDTNTCLSYKKAAQAAKGFGPGSGGSCKGRMSGLEAAFEVLGEADRPMRVGEMANAAIARGLWSPDGLTPEMTLSAAIQREVKKGETSRIVKVGPARRP